MATLQELYKAAGYEVVEVSGVRLDHVRVLLEFLALCQNENKEVFQKILAWTAPALKTYAKKLRENANSPLYQGIADLLMEISHEW